MRHGKRFNHLGRKSGHRKAMLANMACSLIEHKRINTTLAKAKALRQYVEPLLTKSKTDSTHSRRVVFSYLKSKDAVSELFREVAPKIAEREGGYTRIVKTGFRLGDSAEMCLIELVDFNDIYGNEEGKSGSGKKRTRRGGAKKKTAEGVVADVKEKAEKAAEAVEKKAEDAAEAVAESVEDVSEKADEVAETVEEKVEEKVEDVKDAVADATDSEAKEDEEDEADKNKEA